MTIKEWLNRAHQLDKEIKALLNERNSMFDKATGVNYDTKNEKVQTSIRNTTEDRFVNYAAYSQLIDKRIDKLYAVKLEIISAINKVDDTILRTLLIEKYINFKTWERIASDMNYSYVHVVHNLHPKALNYIAKIVNSI